MPEKKEALKPFPFKNMGVNENAIVRMIKMVAPYCPVDDRPMIKKYVDGRVIDAVNPAYTGEANCQSGAYTRGWEKECESKGHNPYYTTRTHEVLEDDVDENGYIIGSKRKIIKEQLLNVVQVSLSVRHNSGDEVNSARRRGFKFLPELGYEEVCEMRACFTKVHLQTSYGKFCNERHARLVAADYRKLTLVVGSPDMEGWAEERENQLNDINLGSVKAL